MTFIEVDSRPVWWSQFAAAASRMFWSVAVHMENRVCARRARRAIAHLDAHLLKDIGLHAVEPATERTVRLLMANHDCR